MNAPTLIVGLGGVGSKVVLRVAHQVMEQTSGDMKERIAFAVFDTDVNELRKIGDANPFITTIQTSTKLSVGEYLDIDTHARDNWFPVNAILNSKTLTEGAGQVRAVSRMAFETALRAGKMEPLHRAIEDLYKLEGEEYQQALRVIIVSTLAGGTGSGLIIPVALYIKNYLATRFRQSANITRGFFLLPEILYGAIPGQAERNNLKSNAYATLREIDAFLMKGDSTLPEQYQRSVRIMFPSVSSDEYEEYNVRPFDFCFLFDAQNADGKKLNSFTQYLDHAANCIYAQSIGPMNKQSNSSEDNTIRKLVSERGRNRFAGAGTSMLIYPVNVVKRYLALNWAKENVSGSWLLFDKTFRDQQKQNADMRRKGVRPADIKLSTTYINAVESYASNKDPFAMSIIDACSVYDQQGVDIIAYKWDEYFNALKKKISDDSRSSASMELENQRSEVGNTIANLPTAENPDVWSSFAKAYYSLKSYKVMTQRRCEDSARTMAYSMFNSDTDDITSARESHVIETYMRDENQHFMHPCAIRYFLYKVLESLSNQRKVFVQKVKDENDFFDTFEEANFDDTETPGKEGAESLALTKSISLMDKIRKRYSADQMDLVQNYEQYLGMVDEFKFDSVFLAVLNRGIEYVEKLCASFEAFFNTFDSKLAAMDKEIASIESRYVKSKGTAARYVCASKKCLDAMLKRMPYTGGAIEINSDLAAAIYLRILKYSMLTVKADNDDYFRSIFDDDIISFFEGELMKSYSADIDIDVITAIEKEAEYEKETVDSASVGEYIRDVIEASKILAAPFIEKPLGEEKNPINVCTYNIDLYPHDDSQRSQLLDELLGNFGGTPDEDIPRNMVLFYKSFYGLRANELSKFAPPQKSETYERSGGEYYKAYFDLVSKIHPIPSKSKVITPHIDRWWHNVTMMPDLDEANQEKQLNDIYSAFFWALVCKKIGLYDLGPTEKGYRIRESLIDKNEDTTLTVANGTPCDQLYEILDAMAVYPELVSAVLRDVNNLMNKEIEAGKSAFKNELYDFFSTFTVDQIGDEPSKTVRSIFELPFMLKRSMTPELYNESSALRVLEMSIGECRRLLKSFSSETDYADNVAKVFKEQFDRLVKNLAAEDSEERSIFRDYLFDRSCELIEVSLKNLGLDAEAREIRKQCDALSKGIEA